MCLVCMFLWCLWWDDLFVSCDTRVTVVVAKMSLLLDRSQLVYLATSLLDLTTREALMSELMRLE